MVYDWGWVLPRGCGSPSWVRLWKTWARLASKGPSLTLQALGCRPAEKRRIAGHLSRPKQSAQQPVTGLVQRPRGLLALQQAYYRCHVWQGHLSWAAGSCGKGRIWDGAIGHRVEPRW